MCGLHGVAGNGIQQTDLKIFMEFGVVNQVRGMDGSGIFQVNSRASKNWQSDKLFKLPGDWNYTMYMNAQKKDRVLDNLACDYIMGHVRYATSGGNSIHNCHPFKHGTIVGAHNGTLKDRKYQDKDRTDSDFMFEDISRRGIADVLRELDRDSAYAITMYDSVSKNFIFARNEQRPLYVCVNEHRAVLYWHSDKWLMKAILERHGAKTSNIVLLNPGTVWITNSKLITTKGEIHKVFTRGPRIFYRDAEKKTYVQFLNDDHAEAFYKALSETKAKEEEKKEEQKVLELPPPKKPANTNKAYVKKRGTLKFGEDYCCMACEERIPLIEQYKIRTAPNHTYGYYDETTGDMWCNECCSVPESQIDSNGKRIVN